MTQAAENPFITMLSQIAGDQMVQMDEERKQFHERLMAGQAQVMGSENRVIDRLTRRRPVAGPQYPPEVKAIADMLVAFPTIVPTVKAVIMKFTAETEKTVKRIEGEYMNDPTIQEIIKKQQEQEAARQAAQQQGG